MVRTTSAFSHFSEHKRIYWCRQYTSALHSVRVFCECHYGQWRHFLTGTECLTFCVHWLKCRNANVGGLFCIYVISMGFSTLPNTQKSYWSTAKGPTAPLTGTPSQCHRNPILSPSQMEYAMKYRWISQLPTGEFAYVQYTEVENDVIGVDKKLGSVFVRVLTEDEVDRTLRIAQSLRCTWVKGQKYGLVHFTFIVSTVNVLR